MVSAVDSQPAVVSILSMVTSHRQPAATPPLLRSLNERQVLEAIRSGAPISRAEISRSTGISKPTVSLALQTLLDAGLVRSTEPGPDRLSYGAVFFESVPEAALVVGLDLGAHFLRGAICDLDGRIRARQDVEVCGMDADGAIEAVGVLYRDLVEASGLERDLVDGVVLGVPGVVETETGRLNLATNVPGLMGRDIGSDVAPLLGVPVTVENDVDLAAVGERWSGVAGGIDDFAFLSIGTGMGAGLILRGELYRGRHGAAGELDVMAVERDVIDPCAAAVSDLAREVAARTDRTILRPPFAVPEVFAAARTGDKTAVEVVEELARRIALHIVPVAAVADVELVVLGGGVGLNGDLLLPPIRERLDAWLAYPPRVEVSGLAESAVLMGALAVGLRSARENVFVNRGG